MDVLHLTADITQLYGRLCHRFWRFKVHLQHEKAE